MIVCSECGNAAVSGDAFCASCGVLLEWSGQPVEAAAGAVDGRQPPARKPVAERDRPGPVPVMTEQVYAGPYCSACGVRNPEGRTFCRSCGESLRSGAAAQRPARGWWRRMLDRMRGRRPYAAGDRPRGFLSHDALPGQPATTATAAGGPRLGAPAHGSQFGALGHGSQSGAAGHGSQLGAPAASPRGLGAMADTARQRIRHPKTPMRRALSRYAPLLMVAGLLGVGLGPARVWITTHVFGLAHRAQAQLSQRYANVVPVGASASSSAPGHPAQLAIDGVQQTYWLSGGATGAGATFTVRFASPQKIERVGVLSGEPGGDYRAQARPQTIEFIVSGRPPLRLSFDDTLSFQNRSVSLRGVTAITVVISHVYPGQRGQAVALRELEFFTQV
jgi:hypothetical protein